MKRLFTLLLAVIMLAALGAGAEAPAYTEETIVIDAGDHKIPATLTLPAAPTDALLPAVVMCHGNGSNRHEVGGGYDLLAAKLAEAGIASLRFDYIGNGDSETDYIEFTHEKGVEDALKSVAYLKGQPGVDPARVGIMGWSQGGGIALVAASRDHSLRSVVTWAGALYDGTIDEEAYAAALKDGHYLAEYAWREPLKLSPAYFEVLKNFIVADAVPLIKAPVLAINGALDDVVPPETAMEIEELATNAQSKFLLLDGADHVFNIFTGDMTVFDRLMAHTVQWFKETL